MTTTARYASSTTRTITRYVLVAVPVKGEEYLVTVTGKTGEETFTGRYRSEASTGLRFVVDGKVVTRSTAKIVKIEQAETHEVPADAPAAPVPAPADAPTAPVAPDLARRLGAVFAPRAAAVEPELDERDSADDDAPVDVDPEFSPPVGGGDAAAAEAEPVQWNGRTLGQLSPDERDRVVADAVAELNAELNHPAVIAAAVLGEPETAEAAASQTPAAPAAAGPVEGNEDGESYDPDPEVNGTRLSKMRFAAVMELAKKYQTPGRGVARIGALREGVAKAIAAEARELAAQ